MTCNSLLLVKKVEILKTLKMDYNMETVGTKRKNAHHKYASKEKEKVNTLYSNQHSFNV